MLRAEPGPYRAPRWLPGGHLQTLYAATAAPAPRTRYRRTRWETPDGDFVDLDWVDGPAASPLVVLFHGLEGSSASPYARATMAQVVQRGWRGVVVHFRGCGGEPNRLPRAYHSGDSPEIDWMLRRMAQQFPDVARYAVGVSLGGNALLKWLGESGAGAAALIRAGASVSAPVDLMSAGALLGRGVNRIYTWHFLRTLKPKSLEKLRRFPGMYQAGAVRRATTLRQFDDVVTAPVHGFRDTDDYWTRASSKPLLARIAAPALLIHARNDPFLPGAYLPRREDVSASLELDFPAEGGHVGFVTGPFPGRLDWLPRRVLAFFDRHP